MGALDEYRDRFGRWFATVRERVPVGVGSPIYKGPRNICLYVHRLTINIGSIESNTAGSSRDQMMITNLKPA